MADEPMRAPTSILPLRLDEVSFVAGGRPIVTPVVRVGVGASAVRVRVQADLLSLDLGTSSARALPGCHPGDHFDWRTW